MNTNDNFDPKIFLTGVRTALTSGASHDDIINEISKQKPEWAEGISQARAGGASSLDILKEMSRQASSKLNAPEGTQPSSNDVTGTLKEIPGELLNIGKDVVRGAIRGANTAVEAPYTLATGGGVAQLPQNTQLEKFLGGTTAPYQQTTSQEVAQLDPNDPNYKLKVAQATASGVGGAAGDIANALTLGEAGSLVKSITPAAKDISGKVAGRLSSAAEDIYKTAKATPDRLVNESVINSLTPDLSKATDSSVNNAIKGNLRGIGVEQKGNLNIAKISDTGKDAVKVLKNNLDNIGITPQELLQNPSGSAERVRTFAQQKSEQLANELGGNTTQHDTSWLTKQVIGGEHSPIAKNIYGSGIRQTPGSDELIDFIGQRVHPKMTASQISSLQTQLNNQIERIAPKVFETNASDAATTRSVREAGQELRKMLYDQLEKIGNKGQVKSAKTDIMNLYNASEMLQNKALISGGKTTLGQKAKAVAGSIGKSAAKHALPAGIAGAGYGAYKAINQ